MDKLLNKITKHILLYDLLFIGLFLILNFFLYQENLILRLRASVVIILLLSIGFIGGIFQLFLKLSKKMRIYSILSLMLITLIILNLPIPLKSIKITSDQTVKIGDKKYVAKIKDGKYTDISYYDYFGPFLMGTKEKVHGYFEGNEENPYKAAKFPTIVVYSFFDNNGIKTLEKTVHYKKNGEEAYTQEKVIKMEKQSTTINEASNESKEEKRIEEETKVLAEYKFGKTVLRFINLGYVLGQNQLVGIEKSINNGKNFNQITKDVIQVSNEARFIFLNEKLGFVITSGTYNMKNGTGIYVTRDGGKTFENATINYESKAGIDYFLIEETPYQEKGQLKIDCLIYDIFGSTSNYDEKMITFTSKDKGLTWNIEK